MHKLKMLKLLICIITVNQRKIVFVIQTNAKYVDISNITYNILA
jgi:hypothetical protein